MKKITTEIARPCRIFMCYRDNTAAVANIFRQSMGADSLYEYGNIWYSDLEGFGNFIKDIPLLIHEAEWILFFVGNSFTRGFLDTDKETNTDNIAAKEMIAIEKERQMREKDGKSLKMLSINIDGAEFDENCAKDLRHLFRNEGILTNDSVDTYRGLNHIQFRSRTDRYMTFIRTHIAPYCALGPRNKMKSYEELLQSFRLFFSQASERCDMMERAGQDCIDNSNGDANTEVAYYTLMNCIDNVRASIETLQRIMARVQIEYEESISAKPKI